MAEEKKQRHPNSLANLHVPTHEQAVERGRLGGRKQGVNKRRRISLAEVWEQWGESRATKLQKDFLAKFGLDGEGMNQIQVLAELMKIKAFDPKTSVGDIMKLADTYGKYTKQEPTSTQEVVVKTEGLHVNLDLVKDGVKRFYEDDKADK